MARFRNRPIRCLLDSGCERNVVCRRCVQGVRLKRTQYVLSAANKTALSINGDADLHFTIDGHAVTANVSVSPVIDELLLGSDWLVQNQCRWDFAAGTVYIGDRLMHTYGRVQVYACRRIFVSEKCVVPSSHEASISVRMMYDNIHCPSSDWAVKPRVIRPGVVVARTLLSDDRVDVVARVCNYSDTSHVFKADSFLGLAEPVSSSVGDECAGSAMQAGSAEQAKSAAPVGSAVHVDTAGLDGTAAHVGSRNCRNLPKRDGSAGWTPDGKNCRTSVARADVSAVFRHSQAAVNYGPDGLSISTHELASKESRPLTGCNHQRAPG